MVFVKVGNDGSITVGYFSFNRPVCGNSVSVHADLFSLINGKYWFGVALV